MSAIVFILHLVDRLVDRISVRYARTGKLMSGVGLAALLCIPFTVVLFGWNGIQGGLIRSPQEGHLSGAPPHIAEFRKRLPTGHMIQGTELKHRCGKADSLHVLARKYYSYSDIFVHQKLRDELQRLNPGAFYGKKWKTCKRDTVLSIPRPRLVPIKNQPLGWEVDREIRSIYLQGGNTVPGRLSAELRRLKRARGNGVVFDVKDIIGVVNYRSSVKLVEKYRRHRAPIPDLAKTIRFLHEQGIFVIARMALFQDRNLAETRPDLAIKKGNGPLLVKGRPLWVDPGRDDVQSYNLQLVDELIAAGVDEIQFDYVRYPAEGDLKGVRYHNVRKARDKTDHLVRFLAAAWNKSRGTEVRLSIDVFGIVAWGEEKDMATTGQRLAEMAPFVDIISPMLYPSHFGPGYHGYANPADHPHFFYKEGVRKVLERTKKSPHIVVRPWLQSFKWRVTNYNERYIREQIRGSRDSGGNGWLMWNAGNNYDVAYAAMRRVPEAPRRNRRVAQR